VEGGIGEGNGTDFVAKWSPLLLFVLTQLKEVLSEGLVVVHTFVALG
jgi:hypothetical protein